MMTHPKRLSEQKRDLEAQVEELRAKLGKVADSVPPTVHHKPATLGEQVKALQVEVSRLRYAAKRAAAPEKPPVPTRTAPPPTPPPAATPPPETWWDKKLRELQRKT